MNRILAAILMAVAAVWPSASEAEWTYFDNHSDIRVMLATDSLLWVGTNGGLLLIEPDSGEIVRHMTAGPLLPGNSVRVIEAIGDSVYVGTDNGMVVFSDTSTVVDLNWWMPPFDDVRSISRGLSGTIYIGTFGHGAGLSHPDSLFRWIRTPRDSILDNKVYAIEETDSADVYYATSLGLCAYRDSAWVGFQAGAGLPRGEVIDLVPFGHEQFYVLVAGHGVYRFTGTRGRRIRARNLFPEDDIAAITLDAENRLWAAGRYGGIARYALGKWEPIGDDDPEIAGARWRSAAADVTGRVFLGSSDGMILVIEEDITRKISVPSALPSGYIGPMAQDLDGRTFITTGPYLISKERDSQGFRLEKRVGSVFAIAVAPTGEVWLAAPWGLYRRDDSGFTAVRPDIEPVTPVFVSIAFDGAGGVWAGTHDGEIYRFHGEIWVPYAGRYDLAGEPVRRIIVDGRHSVWALGSRDEVFRYDGSRWTPFGRAHFDSTGIQDLAVGPDGEPVVVTQKAAWRYVGDNTWSLLELPGPVRMGRLGTVYFDKAGRMFLGSSRGVLVRSDEQVRWLTSGEGLRGRNVTSLLVDADDTLWVGFRGDGISRISLEKLLP